MSTPAGTARRPDRAALIVAAGLAAFGGTLVWDAMRLATIGGYSQVGPGTVPKVVGIGLLLLAAATVVSAVRGSFPERDRQHLGPVAWVVAGLLLQLLLLKIAGFSIASGLMFACVARGFGKRNLGVSIPAGIGFSLLVWLIFSQLLMLNLPAGPIETFIAGLLT